MAEKYRKSSALFPALGYGLGLRAPHYNDALRRTPQGATRFSETTTTETPVSWFEVTTENFMVPGGRAHYNLEKFRQDFPLVFHGVSLSIASVDPLEPQYMKRFKEVIDRYEPVMVSDHLCWAGVNGQHLHDLLPIPFTEEALNHIVERVDQVQNFLGRRILLENVSSYLSFSNSEMSEWEFLAALTKRADCGLLLDVNNVYVSSVNHGFDPMEYLRGIPADRVGQFHLAGHSTLETETGGKYLIDTHDEPVCDEVWELYGEAVRLFGSVATMIERDANIPEYDVLVAELMKAKSIGDQILEQTEHRELSRATELATELHHAI